MTNDWKMVPLSWCPLQSGHVARNNSSYPQLAEQLDEESTSSIDYSINHNAEHPIAYKPGGPMSRKVDVNKVNVWCAQQTFFLFIHSLFSHILSLPPSDQI